VGCGAVGSLFAANLSLLDDVEVWAFDLNELHVAAMNRDGLRLSGAGDVVGQVRATADAAELEAALDPDARNVGIGVARGTLQGSPELRTAVVLVLGTPR